jgi:superfamily II DNA or RNA helicase
LQQDAIVPGETVWLRQQRWRVERLRHDRDVIRLDLANRSGRRTFWLPFDRLERLTPRLRFKSRRPRAALARLGALVARTGQARTLPVLVDATLSILPHQLEPALAIFAGARRVLLADAVGLGKTLQSAIVVAELVRRDAASRILIVVPASIVAQWEAELRTRFHLPARIADREGLDEAGRDAAIDEDLWRRSGIWIATLDFLKQRHVLSSLPDDPWDLVIVDEAHGACGHTERYAAAGHLLQRARRCMLLTATPHSGDEERYSRLLKLGALPGIPDEITIFRRSRAALGAAPARRVRWVRVRLSPREIAALDALAEFERATARAAGPDRIAAATLMLSVFRKRALSTMSALTASLERRAAWLDLDAQPAEVWHQSAFAFDVDGDVGDENRALTAVTGLALTLERRWLKRLIALARAATTSESKLAWIARLLARTAEPVVLFTEFRDSLEAARARLQRRRAIAVLHGGQRDFERAAGLSAFLDGRASVLIATDVAGQGLNLQHRARWVLNLELPWNPVRLEQRAGRVDRIGQTRGVHVTSTVAQHDAEAGLLARLARRTLVARRALDDATLPIVPAVAIREHDVAGAVLLGRPLPESPATHAPLCTRWRRDARAIARSLRRRRRLASAWRGPGPGVAPVTRSSLVALTAFSRIAPCWLVFIVSIVDGAGAVLESHAIAVTVPSLPIEAEAAAIASAAGLACRACRARARRLAHLQNSSAQRDIATERALATSLDATQATGLLQQGLFDRRAERRALAVVERRTIAAAARADRIEAIERSAGIRVGPAALAVVLCTRR